MHVQFSQLTCPERVPLMQDLQEDEVASSPQSTCSDSTIIISTRITVLKTSRSAILGENVQDDLMLLDQSKMWQTFLFHFSNKTFSSKFGPEKNPTDDSTLANIEPGSSTPQLTI